MSLIASLEQIGQWSHRVKMGIFSGVALLLFIMAYFLLFRSAWEQWNGSLAEEQLLKAEFSRKSFRAARLGFWQKQQQIAEQHYSSLLKMLPIKNEMHGLLEEISQSSILSGLKYELFAPQLETVHGFYRELPIQLSVVGSYFQMAHFLSHIAQMNRLVTFDELIMARRDRQGQLEMRLTVKIYGHQAA